ncbi:recombination protein F [Aquisphaera giovannonii]|uniref:Recombination protein F n=1 Tax=Aquisphaera giovannonii TaxID=406548 RepID=A0A5B9VWR6_9BACT|nr:ATP-binding protein [Aquisphaera giovannonii]QEH32539.1 recombination protein F [Aquisphaera giovannonii]
MPQVGYDEQTIRQHRTLGAATRCHRMLQRLNLKNFTVFQDAEVEFVPGINVFLGANATGKTHAMKVVYALIRSVKDYHAKHASPTRRSRGLEPKIEEKLSAVFRPEAGSTGRLVRRFGSSPIADVSLTLKGAKIEGGIDFESFHLEILDDSASCPASLFLPAREVLSIYPGFLAAYQNRELAFDETYYDLCLALSASPLRGRRGAAASSIREPLVACLDAEVVLRGDSFFVKSEDDGIVEAHLVAEGYRKIATLLHLIANGSLAKGSVLFWDEPEANLNPRLTKVVADFLLRLAGNGIQVVLATHDYLLTNELSLQAEYQTDAARRSPIRFFSFTRGKDQSVGVQWGATLADLAENPIMEEFQALYDRERRLFLARDEEPAGRGD